jgi:hypothetical protein
VTTGEEEGVTCVYTLVSSKDEWDHYSGLTWWSVDDYMRDNPGDPDIPAMLEWMKWKDYFLRWGRKTLGFAIYVFRKP